MSLYKTKGIVLKTTKLGEADKIITFLTDSRGKVRAVAKGIRKTKSKFGCRLEPFSHVDLLVYASRHSLDIVTQAELIRPFDEIRGDLDRLTYGSGMLDLTEKVAVEGDVDAQLFNLLVKALEAVSRADRDHRLFLTAFDLKLMSVTGYQPKLDGCVSCGDDFAGLGRFSNERGGAVCERCFDLTGLGAPVSPAALALMARLLRSKLADLLEVKAEVGVDDAAEAEAFRLTGDYLAYHLQSRLRSREYLNQLQDDR